MSTAVSEKDQIAIKPVPILISFLIAGFIGLFSETALNMALGIYSLLRYSSLSWESSSPV